MQLPCHMVSIANSYLMAQEIMILKKLNVMIFIIFYDFPPHVISKSLIFHMDYDQSYV
jgi:hypothetical protein